MKCLYCGCELVENVYGDLVCPIDGIIEYNKNDFYNENKESYKEYIG